MDKNPPDREFRAGQSNFFRGVGNNKVMIRLIFPILVAAALAAGVMAQTDPDKVGVEEIFVAKDNGAGKAGDTVESFLTTDVPIHCIVQLDSFLPATVRMNFVAVGVKGVKPETRVVTVSFKTNGKQNQVYFTGKPGGGAWVAGDYRIDIFVNDKLAGSRSFPIARSTVTTAATNNFATPVKPKPRRSKKP